MSDVCTYGCQLCCAEHAWTPSENVVWLFRCSECGVYKTEPVTGKETKP
jgi:hypothetical protein